MTGSGPSPGPGPSSGPEPPAGPEPPTGPGPPRKAPPTEPPTEVLPRLDDRPTPTEPTPRADGGRWRWLRVQAPALAVLAVVAIAFLRIAEQHWRQGTTLLGLALLLGAVLRSLCSENAAGLLAVRDRRVDVVLYAAFGLVVVLVSLTVTGSPLTTR